MKKKHFLPDVISFAIIVFNVISVFCFLLPPGRLNYLPALIMEFTMLLTVYTMFGLGISGAVGVVLNIFSIILKKKKGMSVKNNIVYIILFGLTIPVAWLLLNSAMSV